MSGGAGIDQFHRGVANIVITIVHADVRSGICSEQDDKSIVVPCTEKKYAFPKKCQSTGIRNLPSGYSPSNSQSWGPEGKKTFRFVDAPLFCPAFVVAQLDANAGVAVKMANNSNGNTIRGCTLAILFRQLRDSYSGERPHFFLSKNGQKIT